jgi:hypothetical protein
MSKKERRNMDDEIRVLRGGIPWSVAEYDWVIAAFDERRKKNENLPLPEEFAEYKQEFDAAHGEDLENFKDMILFSCIFHQRYPKKIEYDAHSYRFNQINNFLITHEDKLFQLKLIYINDEKKHVDPQLMKALCTMMYDEEDFDESGEWIGNIFSFEDAIAQTQAKINKKPSNKRLTEEQGFKGLIPWSLAEFRWVMNQHTVRRLNSEENRTLEDEYLPLKIQMRRQTGKTINNFDTMVLLNGIFHERYSNSLEAMAHFFRYRSIFMFVEEYKDQLIKESLVNNASGDLSMEPELIESLCILPYSLRETEKTNDKKHAFLYKEVVAKAKALRSARLN